ncbi:MAG: metallophosphoesterase family protein [Desulfobacterales bacterium]|nr:metallophosphoesterase family protein [Desulfobacterales bacterium]
MNNAYPHTPYKGLLVIGDPHLEARIPGFRKDDYPRVILEKLRWSLDYARRESLLPIIPGDLFHLPRSNPNWLLAEVMDQFDIEILGIYGNHDVHENTLTDDDTLRVVQQAGRITLLDSDTCYRAQINGRPVVIGGTPWGRRLPTGYSHDTESQIKPLVVWLTHHDIIFPGYEDQGRIRPKELAGIDLVINGHIHRRLGEINKGRTCWLMPGNISRRSRSDATRNHLPAVLRVNIDRVQWHYEYIEVPHQPFETVFHEAVAEKPTDEGSSAFISGLAELQARRTQTGEGLMQFLNKNLDQFEDDVISEIQQLAYEVTRNDGSENQETDD